MKLSVAVKTAADAAGESTTVLFDKNVSLGKSLAYLTKEEFEAMNGAKLELTGKSQLTTFTPKNGDAIVYPSLQVSNEAGRKFKLSLNALVSNFSKDLTAESEIGTFKIALEHDLNDVSDRDVKKFRATVLSCTPVE